MLLALRIKDLAIIEDLELELGPGLNVLTGETGAGKSIIVGAAGLLRGGRADPDGIRAGCEEAAVEALFDLSRAPEVRADLSEAGISVEGAELLVRRVISRAGRGRVYLNGGLCTVALLGRAVSRLLDISGQHEHQRLSEPATHRELLDALGTPAEDLAQLERIQRALRALALRRAQTRLDDRERAERVDFLRFQLHELEQARLVPGEEQDLEQEQRRLTRAAELLEAARRGEEELYSGEASVAACIARVRQRLAPLVGVDARLEPYVVELEEARVLAEDVGQSLAGYAEGIDLDPARLEQVEERLGLIVRLTRKHGGDVGHLVEKQAAMAEELADLEAHEERAEALEVELATLRRSAEELAGRVSERRRGTAATLCLAATKELQKLRMPGARLEVELGPLPFREGDEAALRFGERRLGGQGWDRVELRVRTHASGPTLPLKQIASGGELSRIMLAVRQVLGAHDPVQTSIYDEVDAGIGGAVADVVGRALAAVARHRQVICVTHLPQVAAHAARHLSVEKSARGAGVQTSVRLLEGDDRVEELARMLGGARVSARTRANARELLETAAGGRARRRGARRGA